MGRPAKSDKFEVAEKIIELAESGDELTIYNIYSKLRRKYGFNVRQESVRRILNEFVRLKILAEYPEDRVSSQAGRRKKPYKLLWDTEKARAIIQCWKEFHSLRGKLNALKSLVDSKEQEFEFSELTYKFCPYLVLLGIDWIEGITGFLGKFDWRTFLDYAIPLYGAVFSLKYDQELRVLNEEYPGGEFFIALEGNSCDFFEKARWVEYVARRKAKMEIENKLLETFYKGNEFKCASIHYGDDGVPKLSNYILGVRYFVQDSRLVVFDLSPNPFLTKDDDEKVATAFETLVQELPKKHPEVEFIQVRSVSSAMGELLKSMGFEECCKFYLSTRTEKVGDASRFIVEFSKNQPLASEREWAIRVFEKPVK
ncbi:hypothetical protein [Thermococcus gorgonarius]|uniref:Uncharacterized protein n=1 Tax=Thermococcus gorgonarius TaxID=71997 RepID=A0A2Z2M879_THEGO|nr:hypothetical protein [Thermococcus gorgonarius]ASJ01539.1 hypothetical protein A3K92_08630 [Thermococcus gorgonarius]